MRRPGILRMMSQMKAIKRIPMRMCAICRAPLPKREMLRLVRSQDGQLSVDETGRKPGRGFYICHNTECMEKALKGSRLEKLTGAEVGSEIKDHLKKSADGNGGSLHAGNAGI